MTDPEDKTGRHGWANKVPLMALIVFVAGVATAVTEAKFTRKAVDDLSTSMKESTAASNARLKQLEEWRIQHEAISAPLMQDYIEERRARIERGKRK